MKLLNTSGNLAWLLETSILNSTQAKINTEKLKCKTIIKKAHLKVQAHSCLFLIFTSISLHISAAKSVQHLYIADKNDHFHFTSQETPKQTKTLLPLHATDSEKNQVQESVVQGHPVRSGL